MNHEEKEPNGPGPSLDELPPILTVEEVAKVLRISRSTAYEAVRRGEIPSVRIGRNVRILRKALLQLLEGGAG